jgi:hypothetical protein
VKVTLHATTIELGGAGLKPGLESVVIGQTPCQFTGAPHMVSGKLALKVLAKGEG